VQVKEGPAGSVNDIINQDLKNNNVFVYMKVGPTLEMSHTLKMDEYIELCVT
jgi:hypothetical protein